MTLSTTFYIDQFIDTDAIFDFSLILATPKNFGQAVKSYGEDEKGGKTFYSSDPTQNLKAQVALRFRKNGKPLAQEDQYTTEYYTHAGTEDGTTEIFKDIYITQRKCFAEITFESELDFNTTTAIQHKDFILSLNEYLTKRKVSFSWSNDFTNGLNQGTNGLEEFIDQYTQTSSWFNNLATKMVA